jgi:sulfite exporter TauE/SafE
MIEVVTSVLAASVVGSLHCTSMCGGLVAFGTAGTEKNLRARVGALASYNGARGLGYATLGGAAGALGSTLDHAGLRIGFSRAAGAVAALVMMSWGLFRLLEALGVRFTATAKTPGIHVPLTRVVRSLREKSPAWRSAAVGGCTALLPCGFLHAFLIGAAGTGDAFRGALVMASFWVGTLPAVLGFGLGVGALLRPLRRHANVVGALVLVVFGFANLLERWSPLSVLPTGTSIRGTAHAR